MVGKLRRHAEPSRTLAEALLRRAASAALLVAALLVFHAAAGVEYGRHVADLAGVPVAVPIVDPEPSGPSASQSVGNGRVDGQPLTQASYDRAQARPRAVVPQTPEHAEYEAGLCAQLEAAKPWLVGGGCGS